MNYATNFAIVKNGTVTNLLTGLVYNTMDDFPNAVHTENLDVQIGDTYENGVFMRDGQVVTGSNVGVQSDWNQNDNTQPDYVKNRPFYTGDTEETVLVEESTVTFANVSANIYYVSIPTTIEITAGETYKVSWDGATYERVCQSVTGYTVIGNLSIIGAGADNGDPFLISQLADGNGIEIYTLDTSASHTISVIRFVVSEVVKIDAKYLPVASEYNYGVVKKSEVVTSYKFSLNAPHDLMVEAITAFENGNARIVWGTRNVIDARYDSSSDTISVAFANEPLIVRTFSNSDGFYVRTLGEPKYGYEIVLASSTADSTKKFRITVDDSGTISATEVY